MSFASERAAIEARLSTNWTTTTVQYENVPFTKPNNNTYVALFIINGDATQIDLVPNPIHRFLGTITMQLFVPEGSGTNLVRGYADTLAGIFRNVQFNSGSSGTILCRTPTIQRVGVNSGIYQTNVSVPYQRDKIF